MLPHAKPLIPIRGFGRSRFRGRGGFQGRGRPQPALGGGPKFTSLRNHHEDFYDYQDYDGGGRDVRDREEEERGFGYDNFLNDYETSYPKPSNYNDGYRGRRYPPRRPPSRPNSPPPRSQHGTRSKEYDYDFPAEVYDGPMKAVDYQPSVHRPPLPPQDDYDDYEAEALPNPAALVAQRPPPASDDNRFRDGASPRPQRPPEDYSTLYREKLKRLREFNKRYRHKDRPLRGHSPTTTIFGRDPGDPGGFSDYAFGDLKGGNAPEEGYNTDFVAKRPNYDPGYSPQLINDNDAGYNPRFVESDQVGREPGFNKNFFETDGGGGGGEPGFNKNFFESEGGGGGDGFNRGFFEGGGGGADSYDPMFGDALGGADPFRRIDDDEKEVRWKKRHKKKSPFLDREERAQICRCLQTILKF